LLHAVIVATALGCGVWQIWMGQIQL